VVVRDWMMEDVDVVVLGGPERVARIASFGVDVVGEVGDGKSERNAREG
jgi:hypothetical protein